MFLQTLKVILIVIEVLLIFNLLIFVHELGHFLAAKWRGVYVEEFALWFGKPLWRKKIGGIWYAINSIPAGGYVKLPQMAPMEALEGESEMPPEARTSISPLDKIIVAFAGPLFSFGLAAVFAVLVWIVGRPVSEGERTNVIGFVIPDSPAEIAGLKSGDKVIEVDGKPVTRFGGMGADSITWRVVRSEGEMLPVVVDRVVDGKTQRLTFNPKPVVEETRGWQRKALRQILIAPAETPVVGKLKPGSPAEQAGVLPKDRVVAVGGQPVYSLEDISAFFAAHPGEPLAITVQRGDEKLEKSFAARGAVVGEVKAGGPAEEAGLKKDDRVLGIDGHPNGSHLAISRIVRKHANQPLVFNIERDGKKLDITVTPTVPEKETRGFINLMWDEDHGGIEYDPRGVSVIDHPRPVSQLRKAAMSIFDTVGAIASKSSIGIQHLGGPVMMMRAYYTFFQGEFSDGWRRALWFSVVINVNLALMNMLPLPVLDGGHITIALLEAIRRRPLSLRILEPIQTACALLVIGFMLFVTFFDVQDLPFFGGKDKALKFKKPAASEAQK